MIDQKVTIEAKHDEKRTSTDGYLRNLSENISHHRNAIATKWNRICSLTVFDLFWHLESRLYNLNVDEPALANQDDNMNDTSESQREQ